MTSDLVLNYGRSASDPPSTTGIWRGEVTSIDGDDYEFVIPRLTGVNASYKATTSVPVANDLVVGDNILLSFSEGRNDEIAVLGKINMELGSVEGYITGVTAGTNLNGGGTTGDITLNLDSDITLDSVTATDVSANIFGPIHIQVKNTSGTTLAKGSAVYATGSVGASGAVEVQASDNTNTATMPALGLLDSQLAANAEGSVTILGVIKNIDTSSWSINDELWVNGSGQLQNTRPTSGLVQKIGRVVRVHASTGEILVLGAGRTNDVPFPLFVDHANQRVGIGTTTPSDTLDVAGNTISTGHFTAQSGGADGGIVLGQAFSSSYVGVRTAGMAETGTEYNLITDGANTFLSAGTDGDVYIRGGGNSTAVQMFMDTSAAITSFTGDVAVDNGTLFVDASANRVGINDLTPSYTLDVNGIIRATSYIRTDSSNNVHVSLNATSTSSRPYMEIDHYNGSTYRRAGYVGYPENNASGAHMQMVADLGWVNFWAGGYGAGLRVGNPTGDYGTVETSGAGKGGWEGYNINGWVAFMANSSTGNFGIYDDVNNEWAIYCDFNGTVDLRYNGAAKATTRNTGLEISGDVYVTGLDVVFGNTSSNDYIRYSDGPQGAMGGRFEFVADGSSANAQIVAGTGIFLRDGSLSTHDNYQDNTGDHNTLTVVTNSGGAGGNWVDMGVIVEDDGSVGASAGTAFHADTHNYAPIWRSTTSGGEGLAARTNTESAFTRLLASAFQVNSTEDSKQEIVDAPPLLQRFRDYVAEGHHTKQFRRKEVADPKPAYELKHAVIERDYGKEEADRWLEERTLQNVWTRTDADWLELDKMQNGVEFTEFGVVIDEFGPAFPEVASWESNEDGTEMVPVGLDLSSAIGFLMRLVEDLDEEKQQQQTVIESLESRLAALESL